MKIISKYKDYYDYLVGVNGEDPKLILDRRLSNASYFYENYDTIELYICGTIHYGMYYDDKFHYGEDLLNFGEFENKKYCKNSVDSVLIKPNTYKIVFAIPINCIKDKDNFNIKYNCPILLKSYLKEFKHFPKLKDLNVSSIYSAEEIFILLSNWLSNRLSEKENISDNRSDILKIESKGFNKITSFRPKIKNK